jgi:hypothetical protein
MLLTIGVVYYLRLSTEQRVSFECDLHQMLRDEHNLRLDKVLTEAMDALIQTTELEQGIARTTGLKENVFMVVVCTLARIPLMIVRAGHFPLPPPHAMWMVADSQLSAFRRLVHRDPLRHWPSPS